MGGWVDMHDEADGQTGRLMGGWLDISEIGVCTIELSHGYVEVDCAGRVRVSRDATGRARILILILGLCTAVALGFWATFVSTGGPSDKAAARVGGGAAAAAG